MGYDGINKASDLPQRQQDCAGGGCRFNLRQLVAFQVAIPTIISTAIAPYEIGQPKSPQ
jgi:hypothetical protein